jgi:glycosyltransferase involved in cell wall biosynthesis
VAHQLLRTQLLEVFDIDPDRVAVIPLPIPEAPRMGKAELREPEAHQSVLFFGTLRRNKGIGVLLDAIRQLRGLNDVRFRIAGRGASEVEQSLRNAGGGDRRIQVEIGVISDERKNELFRSATLVVLPYTSFTSQSGVLGDAYAHRIPVVATNVGALGATVERDHSGWVIPPGDATALAIALEKALSDTDGRRSAAIAEGRAAADRSYESIGHQIRDLYERVTT